MLAKRSPHQPRCLQQEHGSLVLNTNLRRNFQFFGEFTDFSKTQDASQLDHLYSDQRKKRLGKVMFFMLKGIKMPTLLISSNVDSTETHFCRCWLLCMMLCLWGRCGIFQKLNYKTIKLWAQLIVRRCCFFTLLVTTKDDTENVCTMLLFVGILDVLRLCWCWRLRMLPLFFGVVQGSKFMVNLSKRKGECWMFVLNEDGQI